MSFPTGTIGRGVRILHTSDWHVGRTMRGRSRADEHLAVLAEVATVAGAEQVDLVVVAGDLFDVAAPTPEAERIVYQALLDLAQVAPVVVVAGNHDHPHRLRAVAPLLELGRVTVGATLQPPGEGGVIEVPGHPARVALIPFVSQRNILRAAELMALGADQTGGLYADRMASVVTSMCSGMTPDTVNLAVAHLMVHGGVLGGGERSAHTIFDYSVPVAGFPGHLSYVALGHLHRLQRIPAPGPVWFSGSPLQLDFGEVEDRKGVLVIDAEPGLPASVREVPLRAGRRLVRLIGSLDEVVARSDALEGAWVQVVLDESARVGLADEVRQLIPDAVDVMVATDRQTAAGTKPARIGRSPHELFVEFLAQRNVEDDRLLRLFSELLAETYESDEG